MAEIYAEDGLCGGYGGSMRLVDPGRGFMGTSGIVGQGIPQATGLAFGAQLRKQGQVVLSFWRRPSKQGAFHESLNLASLWKLPVVYVMENNNHDMSRARSRKTPMPPTASRCRSRRRPTAWPVSPSTVEMPWRSTGGGRRGRPRPRRRWADALRVEGLPAAATATSVPPGVPLHYPRTGHHHVWEPGGVRGGAAATLPRSGRAVEQGVLDPARPTRPPKRSPGDRRRRQYGSTIVPRPEAAARNDYVYA